MLKEFSKVLCVMVIGLALCSVPDRSAFASSYADTVGFGMRAMALGGAFTAVADDYSAVYYNPAGLGQITGFQQVVDVMYINPSIHVEKLDGSDLKTYDSQGELRADPDEGGYGRDLDLPVPIVGLLTDMNAINVLPFHLEMCMAMSMPEYMNVNYRVNSMPPDQPQFIRYGDEIDRVILAVAIGAEIVPSLFYVGGGAQSMIYGGGPGKAYEENIDALQLGQQNMTADMHMPSIQRYDPMAGILITPMAGMIRIGASWRDEELYDTPSETIAVVMAGPLGPIEQRGYMDMQDYFTPEEYSLGIAVKAGSILVSLEANKQLWSRYDFSSSNKNFYGGSPDFKDTINERVGLEFKPDDKTSVMLGFCYQPTPVPNQSGRVTNYLDMDKKIISLGFSKIIEMSSAINPVKIGGTFQYQILDDYTVYKDGISGPTWENQESYTVEGDAYTAGISITNTW